MAQSFAAWLQNRFGITLAQLFSALLTAAGVNVGSSFAAATNAAANYAKTTNGAQTLLAADDNHDRVVLIHVSVTEAFATNTGTKPSFDIGETSTTTKFKSALNSGALGTLLTYTGTLSAGKALLVTGTAAVGDAVGAISVAAVALPVIS
jgi:hypothetical protein